MRKRIYAALVFMCGVFGTLQDANGAQCGISLREPQVKTLLETLTAATANLDAHKRTLLDEAEAKLDRNNIRGSQADSNEHGLISRVEGVALRVESALSETLTLARIRDVMQHPFDLQVLTAYLSAQAHHTRNVSQIAATYITDVMTRITRPGIAVDIAKVRDQIAETRKAFADCDPAKVPVSTPKSKPR
jgi:hypothetical protein